METDFRSALGVPEQDLHKPEEVEKNSAKITGLLRTMAKDKIENFAPKVDASKKVTIHRRRKRSSNDNERKPKIARVEEDIFDEVEDTDDSMSDHNEVLNEMPTEEDKSLSLLKADLIKQKFIQTYSNNQEEEISSPKVTSRVSRRELLRNRLLKKDSDLPPSAPKSPSHDIKPVVTKPQPVVDEETDSEYDDDSSSSSEEEDIIPLQLKFVPKSQRNIKSQPIAIKSQPVAENTNILVNEVGINIKQEEARRQAKVTKNRENKAKIEQIKKNDLGLIYARSDMPDDTDGIDERAEFQEWRLRELKRLKRNMELSHAFELERAETMRRRRMTAAEILEENEELIKKGLRPKEKEKIDMQFLQKYHHKGAFFVDEKTMDQFEKESGKVDPRRRQALAATEADRRNMEILPEVLQRRNFGKKSQSKWTHLSNEDTSKGDNLWKEVARFERKRQENKS